QAVVLLQMGDGFIVIGEQRHRVKYQLEVDAILTRWELGTCHKFSVGGQSALVPDLDSDAVLCLNRGSRGVTEGHGEGSPGPESPGKPENPGPVTKAPSRSGGEHSIH